MEKLEHEESPEVEEAAFEAGFGGGQDTPEAGTTVEQPVQEEEIQEEPVQEQEAPLTRAEFQALEARAAAEVKKVHDKAFGKIGELQQKIEAIKSKTTGLSPRAKERLAEEFPELAEMLFDGGDDPVQPAEPQRATVPNHDDVLEKVRLEREAEKKEIEKRLLRRDHRDWETVVASQSFRGWVATLPPQDQQTLANSWDADFVSQKLGEYKQWNAERQASSETEKTSKNKRLENAVTPRGVARGVHSGQDIDDEEAAMIKAFGG